MWFSRLRPLVLPLLVALSSMVTTARYQVDDAAALRKRAEQTTLSATDRREVFARLEELVRNPVAKPGDRCADFYRAVNLVQRVDPLRALAFAEEMARADWPRTAPPDQHGLFTCGLAIAYLANHDNVRAGRALMSIPAADRKANPMVEALRADMLLLVATAQGNYPEADAARILLLHALEDNRLSIELRAQYLTDALRFLYDEGAPPVIVDKVIAQGKRILPSVRGETADRLGVLIDIVEALTAFSAPWPTEQNAADARVLRLAEFSEKLHARGNGFAQKYGPAAPATIYALEAVASMDLLLTPFAEDESAMEKDALGIANDLIANSEPMMVERERFYFLKGIAAGMLGRGTDARTSYEEVKRIHAAAGIDAHSGLRFGRRLLMLSVFGEQDPDFVASEWASAVEAFATHVRNLASRDPDLALSSLDAWNSLPSYGSLPRHGKVDQFLDGYVQATGIVRNVPFRRGGATDADRTRLYGRVGLPDVQRRLSPENPMLVYVLFKDPLSPYRAYYGGFLLDGKTARFKDLGAAATIQAAVAKWQRSMRPALEGGVGDPLATGREVYDLLVRPLLPGKLPPHLFVVGDQGLETVSFATLRTPAARWLVEDCAVGYLGAMRDVVRDPSRTTHPSAFLQGDKYRDHVRLGPASLSLAAMRHIDRHVQPQNASSASLTGLRSPTYLHLSVHGDNRPVSRPLDLAEASWLVLPGPPDGKHDVNFTARQIATLHLEDTRCVLLAACSAAKSKVLTNEGPGGLRRAFYIAGAHAIISSLLWVPETATSLAERRANLPGEAPGDRLLASVYNGLARGNSPVEALRTAQLAMLKQPDTASPLFWGGFICEGY